MTIGLDLSSLQGPHRMRGIGYTLINLINNMPPEECQKHDFVFFYYTDEAYDDPLELLDLKDFKYTVRPQETKKASRELRGKLNMLSRIAKKLSSLGSVYRGDPRIGDTSGIDVFLQTDQMVTPPRGWGLKKVMIAYDVIPFVLESDYLWGYKTARAHERSRLSALRHAVARKSYVHKLRINARRCDKVIAISETTRRDFMKYVHVRSSKIKAVPLGVNTSGTSSDDDKQPAMHHYADSSWGYLKRPYKMDGTPFLLFIGGADHRRRLDDLVTSFNHLRAQGHDLKLVLAGDIMRGPESIPIERTRTALETSSYADDIIFMGFVDDAQRDWLYRNALAYVFPSLYEGFGLPVLEAMSHGCPVISYRNAATVEVAGKTPMYADSAAGITGHVLEILGFSDAKLKSLRAAGKAHAKKYTWSDTVKKIFDAIGA